MPKSTTLCNQIIGLLYNATGIANIADNAASSPITNIHVSLHTASLTPASLQNTSEATFTNYARVAVPRTTGGWSAPSGGATSNASAVDYPVSGITGNSITSAATGRDASGAGQVFHYGDLNAPIAISNAIQARFPVAAMTITEA
jgi:hypothetical protein